MLNFPQIQPCWSRSLVPLGGVESMSVCVLLNDRWLQNALPVDTDECRAASKSQSIPW
jgi:hypothetical protein